MNKPFLRVQHAAPLHLLMVALVTLFLALGAGPPVKSVVLEAAEDAYVVTDAAATEDPQGLRDQNFGSLDFARTWYASKVRAEEQIVAVSLVKFDLTPLKDREVQSATLQLFSLRADLAQPARLVDVHLVDGAWTEREVTFNNRPSWAANPIATGAVYGGGVWYSWDVSGSVERKRREGAVSYALGLRAVEEKKEENVAFATREAGRNAPRLIVTYTEASSTFPWYIWVAIIAAAVAVAAALAFVVGWRYSGRRRPAVPH